jgi:NDP-hexose-3-ketoreductase
MRHRVGQSVRVGVWGLGRHARRRILPALDACSAVELVGVTTRDECVAREEADRYGCRAWPTPEEMLGESDIDAVFVATPTGLHYRHGARVMEASKDLWCEKTITETLAQARELVQLSREHDRAVCEGLMYLYHPHFATIRQSVADGSLGEVLSLRSQFGIPHLDQPGFRFDRELGGGALLDVAPYPMSAALALLGPELELMQAFVGRRPAVDVDTHGHALLSTDTGAGVYLEWGYERAYKNEISIWGETASLHSDFIFSKPPNHAAQISIRDMHGIVEHVEIEPADSFSLMFHSFALAVHDPSLRETLRDEALLRAIYLDRVRQAQ